MFLLDEGFYHWRAKMSEKSLQKHALIGTMIATFITTYVGSAINVALPSIGRQFVCSATMLSWIVSSYLLSSAVFLLPIGRIADLFGRRKVFVCGISLFGLFSLLCGLSWSIESFLCFRILQGMAATMIYSTGMAIVTSVYPIEKRGWAMGILVTATYTGLTLGPVFGGFLCQRIGWQSIFYVTTIISVIVTVYVLYNIKEEWFGAYGEGFDVFGSLQYMIALFVALLSLSFITKVFWAKYALIGALLLFITFYYYEKRYKYPILNISVFRKNTTFIFSNIAAMINYGSTYAVIFLLSLYLQIVRGYDPQTTGFILLVQSIIMAIFASKAGSLSDVIEPRILASLGMGLNAVGLFIYIFLTPSTPIVFIVFLLALMGLGYALFSSPNSNAIMSSVDAKYYGIASSFLATMRLIGQSLSMAIATLVINYYLGNAELGPENAGDLLQITRTIFVVFTVFCTVGVLASLARGNIRKTAE